MARALCRLPRRCLWLLLAHHLFMATACQEADYGALLQKLCLTQFQVDMEAVGEMLWCDWGKTISFFNGVKTRHLLSPRDLSHGWEAPPHVKVKEGCATFTSSLSVPLVPSKSSVHPELIPFTLCMV
ncbi:receptor activity-modifying protein 1 isoform X2 [Saimiri boliviensis]|uniref:receptor activity-modifying protein 1 isoform X2 n=1 Tax=Saimiri boliviensis TaxID=27679 RepID=UPI003D782039